MGFSADDLVDRLDGWDDAPEAEALELALGAGEGTVRGGEVVLGVGGEAGEKVGAVVIGDVVRVRAGEGCEVSEEVADVLGCPLLNVGDLEAAGDVGHGELFGVDG